MKIVYENIKPVIEALKELARIAVLAVIPILIEGLSAGRINWTLVAASAMVACLKALDKLLHLEGKESGNDTLTRGLTQF